MRAGKARAGLGVLALGALGVVFGDIGTSPPYALQAAFSPELFVKCHAFERTGRTAPGQPSGWTFGIMRSRYCQVKRAEPDNSKRQNHLTPPAGHRTMVRVTMWAFRQAVPFMGATRLRRG